MRRDANLFYKEYKMSPKTTAERQSTRRRRLNEAAQAMGYPTWAKYETAVLRQQEKDMSHQPTDEQIAENYTLWCEYVDPDATMSRQEFDALSIDEKVKIIHDTF